MKRIQCRICREWFEQNASGICSEDCLEIAKKRIPPRVQKKEIDQSWNIRLREKRDDKRKAQKVMGKFISDRRKCRVTKPEVIVKIHQGMEIKKLSQSIEELKKLNQALQERLKEKKGVRQVHEFYDSREWRELRYRAIRVRGRKCECCGAEKGQMHVDHIKPRSLFPNLELSFENLQILCRDCNMGKSNKDMTDWRLPRSTISC